MRRLTLVQRSKWS